MKQLIFLLFLFPATGQAHPGVGIVKDSKGNIFYTDLHQVWKITNGSKTVVVPNVHTHELYIDNNDNLYGEGGYYDDKSSKFYHYLWVYRANEKIDTVIGMKEDYLQQDFSLSRDKYGNEYYTKQFLKQPDTNNIYRKSPNGKETIFATANFKGVTWLHPQNNGSLLYVSNNAIFKIDSFGNKHLIKDNVANAKPSFKFSGNSITIWGVWQDDTNNVYVAVFSDQIVEKIDVNGNMTNIYKSKGNWAPLHGVFDNDNRLWVLESSDKNEVRVTLAETTQLAADPSNPNLLHYLFVSSLVMGVLLLYPRLRKLKGGGNKAAQERYGQ